MTDSSFDMGQQENRGTAGVSPATINHFSKQASTYQARSMRIPWSWMRAHELSAVRSLLGDISGIDILELGAGAGFYTRELIRSGARHVCAVDVSEAMLATLPNGPITPVLSDAATFRLEKRFPVLISIGMLEFAADPLAVLTNAYRHAEDNARFVLLVPRSTILGHLYQIYHRAHAVEIRLFDCERFEDDVSRSGWHVCKMIRVIPFSLAVVLHRNR
jgi:2-polyprenyl-3-methyl-5-hydroxy-6-metoxy-1,4-benzoquinol methylase